MYSSPPLLRLPLLSPTFVANVFFRLVECDISVPSHLRAKFSEMTLIFKNVEVGGEHLGERMLCVARQKG